MTLSLQHKRHSTGTFGECAHLYRLYSFGGLHQEKEHKIMKTKFGMQVNFYLELERKSQPITDFKELTNNPPQYPEI